ncbi:MAG: hypothetical protein ACI9YL_001269, partial [Luteibaculaceae bacterium]
ANPNSADSALNSNWVQFRLANATEAAFGTNMVGGLLQGTIPYANISQVQENKVYSAQGNQADTNGVKRSVMFLPGKNPSPPLFMDLGFTQSVFSQVNWIKGNLKIRFENTGPAASKVEIWAISEESPEPIVLGALSSEGAAFNQTINLPISQQILLQKGKTFKLRLVISGIGENQSAKDVVFIEAFSWFFFAVPYPYWKKNQYWTDQTDPFLEHELNFGLKNNQGIGTFELRASTNAYYFDGFIQNIIGLVPNAGGWDGLIPFERNYRKMDWTEFDTSTASIFAPVEFLSFNWYSPSDGIFNLENLEKASLVFHHFGQLESEFNFVPVEPIDVPDSVIAGQLVAFSFVAQDLFNDTIGFPDSLRISELTFLNSELQEKTNITFLTDSVLAFGDTIVDVQFQVDNTQVFEPFLNNIVQVKYTNFFTGLSKDTIVLTKQFVVQRIAPGPVQMNVDFQFANNLLAPGDSLVGVFHLNALTLGADSGRFFFSQDPYASSDFTMVAFDNFPQEVWLDTADFNWNGSSFEAKVFMGTLRTDTILRDSLFDAKQKISSFAITEFDSYKFRFLSYYNQRDYVAYDDTLKVNLEIPTDTLVFVEGVDFAPFEGVQSYPVNTDLHLFATYMGVDSVNFRAGVPRVIQINQLGALQSFSDSIGVEQNWTPEKNEIFSYTLASNSPLWEVLDSNLYIDFRNVDTAITVVPDSVFYIEADADTSFLFRLDSAYTVPISYDYSIQFLNTEADDFLGSDSLSGTVYFPAGVDSVWVPLRINNDDFYEGPEQASLHIFNFPFEAFKSNRDSSIVSLEDKEVPIIGFPDPSHTMVVFTDTLDEGFAGNLPIFFDHGFKQNPQAFAVYSADTSVIQFTRDTITLSEDGTVFINLDIPQDFIVTGDREGYIYMEPIAPINPFLNKIQYRDSLQLVILDRDTAAFEVLLPASNELDESEDFAFRLVASSVAFPDSLPIAFFLDPILGYTDLDSADFTTLNAKIPPMNLGDTTWITVPILDDNWVEPTEGIRLRWNASSNFLFNIFTLPIIVHDNDSLKWVWDQKEWTIEEDSTVYNVKPEFSILGQTLDSIQVVFGSDSSSTLSMGSEYMWVDSIIQIPGDTLLQIVFFGDEQQEVTESLMLTAESMNSLLGALVVEENEINHQILVSDTNDIPFIGPAGLDTVFVAENDSINYYYPITVSKLPSDSLCYTFQANNGLDLGTQTDSLFCFNPFRKDTLFVPFWAPLDSILELSEVHYLVSIQSSGDSAHAALAMPVEVANRDTLTFNYTGELEKAENDSLFVKFVANMAIDSAVHDSLFMVPNYSYLNGIMDPQAFRSGEVSWGIGINPDMKWGTDTLVPFTFSVSGILPIHIQDTTIAIRIRNGEIFDLNWENSVSVKEGEVDSLLLHFVQEDIDFSDSSAFLPWTFAPGNADDFAPVSGTFEIGPNSDSLYVLGVSIVDDLNPESDTIFDFGFNPLPFFTQNSVQIELIDNDNWIFDWAYPTFSLYENGGLDSVKVVITNSYIDTLEVGYYFQHGTTDYTDFQSGQSGTIRFLPGQKEGFVKIHPIDNDVRENNKSFQLILSGFTAPGQIGNMSILNGTLLEDDGPQIRFLNNRDTIFENQFLVYQMELKYPDPNIPIKLFGHWNWMGAANDNPLIGNNTFVWELSAGNVLTIMEERVLTLNDDLYQEGNGKLLMVIDSTNISVQFKTDLPEVMVRDNDPLQVNLVDAKLLGQEGDTLSMGIQMEGLRRLTNEDIKLQIKPGSEFGSLDISFNSQTLVQTVNPSYATEVQIVLSKDQVLEAQETGIIQVLFDGELLDLELSIFDIEQIVVELELDIAEIIESTTDAILVPIYLNNYFQGEVDLKCRYYGSAILNGDYFTNPDSSEVIVLSHNYQTEIAITILDDGEQEGIETIGFECVAMQGNVSVVNGVQEITILDDDQPIELLNVSEAKNHIGETVMFRGKIGSPNLHAIFGGSIYHFFDATGNIWLNGEMMSNFNLNDDVIVVGELLNLNGHIQLNIDEMVAGNPQSVGRPTRVLNSVISDYYSDWVQGTCYTVIDTNAWGTVQDFSSEYGNYWRLKVLSDAGLEYILVFPESIGFNPNGKIAELVDFKGAVFAKTLPAVIVVTEVDALISKADAAFELQLTDSLIQAHVAFPTINTTYFWDFGDGAIATGETVEHVYQTHGLIDVTLRAVNGTCEAEHMEEIFVIYSTGLSELEQLGLKVFPNPSSGMLNVNFEGDLLGVEILLTDALGKVLQSRQRPEMKNAFDLQDYPAGMYFLQFVFQNKRIPVKVVKF